MFAAITRTPDVYLEELKQQLQDTCGVSVSIPTIWKMLIEAGYTMKKVCFWTLSLHTFPDASFRLLVLRLSDVLKSGLHYVCIFSSHRCLST
jgi:winged helix-turn-helix protein